MNKFLIKQFWIGHAALTKVTVKIILTVWDGLRHKANVFLKFFLQLGTRSFLLQQMKNDEDVDEISDLDLRYSTGNNTLFENRAPNG